MCLALVLAPQYARLQTLEGKKEELEADLSEAGHPQASIGFTLSAIPRKLPPSVSSLCTRLTVSQAASVVKAETSDPSTDLPADTELRNKATAEALNLAVKDLGTLLSTLISCNLAVDRVQVLQEQLKQIIDVSVLLSVRLGFFLFSHIMDSWVLDA